MKSKPFINSHISNQLILEFEDVDGNIHRKNGPAYINNFLAGFYVHDKMMYKILLEHLLYFLTTKKYRSLLKRMAKAEEKWQKEQVAYLKLEADIFSRIKVKIPNEA